MSLAAHADGRLLASVVDHVGTIIFNNPDKHNALNPAMWQALNDVLAAWSEDPSVRVVVLAGAGERAFISGADIGSFDGADAARREAATRAWRDAVARFPRPVIAAIRGWCLGGGVAIAMQADIRIAAESARFGIPAGRLGLAYDADMIARLVSVVGAAWARMLLFTAERIDVAKALRIGLVHEVVADAALDESVATLARSIAANAPLALAAMKLAIPDPPRGERGQIQAAIAACLASEDFAEGRAAFRDKREPVFKGR
jgi:enoyl-CoA hydratase